MNKLGVNNNRVEYKAFIIAEAIDLKACHKQLGNSAITVASSELYYQTGLNRFLMIFNYGVVVFANYAKQDIAQTLDIIRRHSTNLLSNVLNDDLILKMSENPQTIDIRFDSLSLGRFDHEVNKAVMLNLGQSVCLDYYTNNSQIILKELKESTRIMGSKGKIRISEKKVLRLAGKTLQTKNDIAENLYILDSPDITWEDEYIDRLHKTLGAHLEFFKRYQSMENTLKIINENLQLYIEYNHHRESSRLEWIIIILIVIEVINTFFDKLF